MPSMKPSVELARRDAAVQLSCAYDDSPGDLEPISLFDMLTALQVHCFTRLLTFHILSLALDSCALCTLLICV